MNTLYLLLFLAFPIKNITTINQQAIDMDTIYVKKPVYVSFWALWCSQCIKELDKINMLSDSLDFFVLAINEDGNRKKARVASFVRGKKWKFPVMIDSRQKLMRQFGVLALPSSFLYGTDGEVVKKFTGFSQNSEKLFVKLIDSLNSHVDTLSSSTNQSE